NVRMRRRRLGVAAWTICLPPGLTPPELDELARTLPAPPPDDVRDLLQFCSGIEGTLEQGDFTGRTLADGFGLDFLIPARPTHGARRKRQLLGRRYRSRCRRLGADLLLLPRCARHAGPGRHWPRFRERALQNVRPAARLLHRRRTRRPSLRRLAEESRR